MKKRNVKSLKLRKNSISKLGEVTGGFASPFTKFNCGSQIDACASALACTTFPVTCQTLNNKCPTFNYPCQSLVGCA